MKQTSYGTALLWGSPGARRPSDRPHSDLTAMLCSALLCSTCSSLLLSSETSSVFCLWDFSSSRGNTVFSLQWKGKLHSLSQRKADLHRQTSLPWSLIGPSPCKWGLLQIIAAPSAQKHCSDWSKWSCSNWLVKMLKAIVVQVQWDRESQSYWSKCNSRNSCVKRWLRWWEHNAGR